MPELFPTARDLMTQEYLAVSPSLGLLEAIVRLERHAEDTAFVVDERDQLVGLLTEKQCLAVLAARAYDEALAETVSDVMSKTPVSLAPTTDVYAIARAFQDNACGVLPVIEDGHVVGAVTQLAALRTFVTIFGHRAEALGAIEQTAADLKDRPEAIEQMQRVFGTLDPDQIASLLKRGQ